MKRFLTGAVILTIFLGFTSCYKVHHNYILKGEWYLNSLEIDGGSTNFMDGVLPDYVESNGYYKIYMLNSGLARGEYYVHDATTNQDTLNYFVTGTWDLISHDSIYLDMDNYVDGTFYIELINKKEMLLSTDHNQVDFFNIGDVKSVLRISREEPTDPANTIP